MGKLLSSLVVAAAFTVALPASAATVVLDSPTGTSGNGLVYTNGTGANQVKFTATALTYSSSNTNLTGVPTISTPVNYAEGLGVNPSGDNRHTVDNSGALDFILLRFDTSVILNGMTLANNYSWYRDNPLDTDATISFAPVNLASIGQSYLTNLGNTSARNNFFGAVGGALGANDFDSNTTTSGNSTRSFNTGANAVASNVWIIGASISNSDKKVDSFKLTSISYVLAPPPGAVPEPATWAMLILGMGAVGATMRRRKVVARMALA